LNAIGSGSPPREGDSTELLAAADFHLIAAEAGDEVACSNPSEYRAELAEMALASLFLWQDE
jgi:hypothetical protein